MKKPLRRSICHSLAALGLAAVALTLSFFTAAVPAAAYAARSNVATVREGRSEAAIDHQVLPGCSTPCHHFATLSTSSRSVSYGSPITLFGHYFAPDETVKLLWNYGGEGQLQAGSVSADAQGNFSYTLNAPSDPDLQIALIAAIGMTSRLQAITFVSETAALLLTAGGCNEFTIGQTFFLRGGGFGSNERVILTFDGYFVASASTDASGAFTSSILVSCDRGYYSHTVQATGTLSRVSASASFF